MNFLELIFTVCMIENSDVCEHKHIAVDQKMSATTFCAMPTLARWAGDNPGWAIISWQCDYSNNRDEPVA